MAGWEEALEVLRSTEAPRYLSASLELSQVAQAALAGLYASLRPYCLPPPVALVPLDHLLADEEENKDDDKDKDKGNRVEGNAGIVEDRFLKVKELEEYLERDKAKKYGLSLAQHKNINKKMAAMDKEEEEDVNDVEDEGEEEDNDDDEDEQYGGFSFGDVDHDSDEDANPTENTMYENFFESKKQKRNK